MQWRLEAILSTVHHNNSLTVFGIAIKNCSKVLTIFEDESLAIFAGNSH